MPARTAMHRHPAACPTRMAWGTRGKPQSPCRTASGQTDRAAQPKSEAELIRALSEDLALEILASYPAEDFAEADFTSLGEAAVYLA